MSSFADSQPAPEVGSSNFIASCVGVLFIATARAKPNHVTMQSAVNIGGHIMKSAIVKRSIVIHGHKTSVSLEDAFWSSLKNIARTEGVPVSKMVTDIDKTREHRNLSCAIRLFVLEQVRTKSLVHPSGKGASSIDTSATIIGLTDAAPTQ
jgi:predicted DNA-binding ribbon-helix-helix protein